MARLVSRKEAAKQYSDLMDSESYHQHKIVSSNGVLRWLPSEKVRNGSSPDLNALTLDFERRGLTKRSEEWRSLYRDFGYSLSGYQSIFYSD